MKMPSSYLFSCFFFFFFFFFAVSASKFLDLTGCMLGDTNPAITDLKRYLHHFGYLPDSTSAAYLTDNTFDKDLHGALVTYQRNFNLKVTGVLDHETIRQLMEPRCGVPDIINGTNTMLMPRSRLNYAFTGPKWPKSRWHLNYSVDTYHPTIDQQAQRNIFSRAFSTWSTNSGFLFFQKIASTPSDLRLEFTTNVIHTPSVTLADAQSPPGGHLRFNISVAWSTDASKPGQASKIDLESVALHEIGHLLGLAHSGVTGAVMSPSIARGARLVKLTKDDIDGIQALYNKFKSPKEEGEESHLHTAY